MSYTLGEAAKATGKSKPTIQRAIKNGRISAKKNEDGTYSIDPAELHRVFDPVTANGNDGGTVKQSETPSNANMLQREIDLLHEQIGRERETVADLRQRLDRESEERRKLTLMLTDQREKALQKPKQGFWPRLLYVLTGKE